MGKPLGSLLRCLKLFLGHTFRVTFLYILSKQSNVGVICLRMKREGPRWVRKAFDWLGRLFHLTGYRSGSAVHLYQESSWFESRTEERLSNLRGFVLTGDFYYNKKKDEPQPYNILKSVTDGCNSYKMNTGTQSDKCANREKRFNERKLIKTK